MGRGGGGGGLRILPHKSWNVYGYEQQLKVRADEAKFAAEVERVEALKRKNEAEYRLQVMRQRAVRGGEGEGEGHEGDADYNQGEESGVEQTTQDHSQADRDGMPQLERDPYSRTIADIQSAVTAPAAASSSSRSSIRRYVIEEEDRNERMPEDASASTVDASGSTLPATSMSFLGDIGLSAKASEIARLKASNTRASELAAQRRYAPVSCFVESFRDENDPTTFGALRPWYTRTSEAAEKMLQQQQKQHQQLQHKAASTNNANSGRRRRRQPLDTIGQHESQDPLVEMKQHLRELKAYERSATDHATSTNSSFPSSFASVSAPPSFAPSNPSHMRASRWDNIIPADASMVQPSFTRTPREVKEPVDVDRKSDAKRSRSRSCSRKDRKKSKKRTRKRSRSSSASSSSSSSSSSSVSSSSSSSSDSDSDSDSDHRSRRRRHRHRSKKSKKEKKKKKRRHDSPSKQKHHRSHHTSAYHAAPLPVSSHPIQVSSHVDSSASGVVPSSSSSSVDLLSSLRAGRLARERQEREKVAALLNVPAWATFEQHLMHKR